MSQVVQITKLKAEELIVSNPNLDIKVDANLNLVIAPEEAALILPISECIEITYAPYFIGSPRPLLRSKKN